MKLCFFEIKKLLRSRSVQLAFLFSLLMCIAALLFLNTRAENVRRVMLEHALASEENALERQENTCEALEAGLEQIPEGTAAAEKIGKNLEYQRKELELQKSQIEALIRNDVPEYLAVSVKRLRFSLEAAEDPAIQLSSSKKELEKELRQNEALLKRGIDPFQPGYEATLINALLLFFQALLPLLLPLFCAVLSQTYRNELSSGTLTFLFTQPYSRARLYLSKYVAVFLVLLLFLILSGGCLAVLGLVLGGRGPQELLVWDSEAAEQVFLSIPKMTAAGAVSLLFYALFLLAAALLLSSFFTYPVGYYAALSLPAYLPVIFFRPAQAFSNSCLLFLGAAAVFSAVLLGLALYRYSRLEILSK